MLGMSRRFWEEIDRDLVQRSTILKAHIERLKEISPSAAPEGAATKLSDAAENPTAEAELTITASETEVRVKRSNSTKDTGTEGIEGKSVVFTPNAMDVGPNTSDAAGERNSRGYVRAFALASADTLIDIAQAKISKRALMSLLAGVFFSAGAVGVCGYAINAVNGARLIPSLDQISQIKDISGTLLTIILVEKSAVGAFYLATIYFFASLGKSFLHESTRLYNQRQALRVGRIIVFLEESQVEKELLYRIFDSWADARSAFQDIDASQMSRGPTSPVNDLIGKIGELFGRKP